MDPPLIIVGIIALVIIIAILGSQAEKRRREALRIWAASHEMQFDPGRNHGLDNRFSQFSCLRRGSGRYGRYLMSGDWNGRPLLAFDYHYETHSTDSKGRRQTHHHWFSAVILWSDIPLKSLSLRPEGFFDRVTEFFGLDDIDFESAEFSRRFYVKAADKRWAYDVIQQSTMEFLLAQPQFTLEMAGDCVIAHRASRFKVEDFESAADLIAGILERLPEYLRQQQAAEGESA